MGLNILLFLQCLFCDHVHSEPELPLAFLLHFFHPCISEFQNSPWTLRPDSCFSVTGTNLWNYYFVYTQALLMQHSQWSPWDILLDGEKSLAPTDIRHNMSWRNWAKPIPPHEPHTCPREKDLQLKPADNLRAFKFFMSCFYIIIKC